jgi:hypothetical protein
LAGRRVDARAGGEADEAELFSCMSVVPNTGLLPAARVAACQLSIS